MKTKGLFITGTDTGVGKTWVTVRLLERLRSAGVKAVGMKPVECGGREDSTAIFEASGGAAAGLLLEEVNAVCFPEPLAPAAASVPRHIDFDKIRAGYEVLANRYDVVIVEGAGGWLVPLDRKRTMADLAVELDLPVLLVAANRLGVLNHTLLTVRAIKDAELTCHGVLLNDLVPTPDLSCDTNHRILREMLPGVDIFGRDLEGIIAFS